MRHYFLSRCWTRGEGHLQINNNSWGAVLEAAFHIIVFCKLLYFIFTISVIDTNVQWLEDVAGKLKSLHLHSHLIFLLVISCTQVLWDIWLTHRLYVKMYVFPQNKNIAKISRMWLLPSCPGDIILKPEQSFNMWLESDPDSETSHFTGVVKLKKMYPLSQCKSMGNTTFCHYVKFASKPGVFHGDLVPSINMEEAGFMTYTAASHQRAIKMCWLYFLGAFMSSSFIYS